ncbi:MAG: GNAT family N-acetyltransferase [Ruminococcus sp.]|nr:GNAT family N-acetyltransferase [Ruminococcus sp.]
MVQFVKVSGSLDIIKTACLANQIFGQHFSSLMPRVQIDYILDNDNSFNVINERITTGGYSYYHIVNDNRQVGFFAVVPRLGDTIEITGMGLVKRQRSKGIGKKAAVFIKDLAKEQGAKTIKVKVNKKNEMALKAFTTFGFEQIGEEQTKLSGDFFTEDVIMTMTIEDK